MPVTMSNSNENSKEQDTLIVQSDVENGGSRCAKLFKTKTSRLASMLTLIGLYFLAEIIVGHLTSSLTLVADSFHMLSDELSMIVALIAVRMSKRKAHESITAWPSKHQYFNTFGWIRFEVVGALINATFLLALCVSIFMEAIEKFYEPNLVNNPELILAVGGGGLVINVIGLVLFGSHAHAGHDHSHGGHDHQHDHKLEEKKNPDTETNASTSTSTDSDSQKRVQMDTTDAQQMNMRAVFLHVLGDALGSVIVMISATVVIFVPHDVPPANQGNCSFHTPSMHLNGWIMYIDPFMSVVLVCIMISTTVPLFKKSSLILLQTVPKNISVHAIREKIERIEGVQEIHEFHIWQLAGDKYVATVHLQCIDAPTYLRVAKEMREKLHEEHIHSLTIQPEFKNSPTPHCSMVCTTDLCKTKVCCEIDDSIVKTPKPTPAQTDRVMEISEIPKATSSVSLSEFESSTPMQDTDLSTNTATDA
ncbi:proton-coupled zinc antiporter SLC30A1-like isoform X2 [Clavelina lepadiformis]|uniref:proton-coupled zinc antiporter SLC30A1-like isoform X2 n=1 Tax=Clavelina lepadiformis TaxID=159417 RepID=UPI0040437B17